MDLITCLPKSERSGSIIVVVDRFSKHGTFIVAPPDVTANDTTKLFFKNVVKYWGVPNVIVSDRDLRVTGRFWTELFKIIGTDLKFSKNFHPQTDGQTERVNALLELYLWHYMSANQHDWNKLLDESSPTVYKTMKEWHEQADLARASLDKAAKKMKKWEDGRRRHIEFEVGDQVMLKNHPVFHVSFFKPYHGHEKDSGRGVSKRVPTIVVTLYDWEVEEILSDRTIRRRGVPRYKEYLIKWRDLPDSEDACYDSYVVGEISELIDVLGVNASTINRSIRFDNPIRGSESNPFEHPFNGRFVLRIVIILLAEHWEHLDARISKLKGLGFLHIR
ncbi:putative nucleotidyltransferase, ribonuclease H [Tanacetum coccineum]